MYLHKSLNPGFEMSLVMYIETVIVPNSTACRFLYVRTCMYITLVTVVKISLHDVNNKACCESLPKKTKINLYNI